MDLDASPGTPMNAFSSNAPPSGGSPDSTLQSFESARAGKPAPALMDQPTLEALLQQTQDPSKLHMAESQLAGLAVQPGMATLLLQVASQPSSPAALPAAAYLRNLVRLRWSMAGGVSEEEKAGVRRSLLQVVLVGECKVVKVLAETFRLVLTKDFVPNPASWPSLIPDLRQGLQSSNLMNGQSGSPILTANALELVHVLLKPYQYFRTPGAVKEAAPPELEAITQQLLAPLHDIFHLLVDQAAASAAVGEAPHDALLHTLCKILHHTVAAYMPTSLLPMLPALIDDSLKLLEAASMCPVAKEAHLPRARAIKRTIQFHMSLITRHRALVSKSMARMCAAAGRLVQSNGAAAANQKAEMHDEAAALGERIMSLSFDLLARMLETGAGWKLLAPEFGALVENAIFPALCLRGQDSELWEEDGEEYLLRNLPSQADDPSGFREDLFTARTSALNLLGIIATSRGPGADAAPTESSGSTGPDTRSKRKKARAPSSKSKKAATAGDSLLAFLAQIPLPSADAEADSPEVARYYGALLAYGGCCKFLSCKNDQTLSALLRARVLPIFSRALTGGTPYLLANANWVLGELAECIKGSVGDSAHAGLLKALASPDNEDGISLAPVRSSAAAAITTLLQASCWPRDWTPLLTAVVDRCAAAEEEDEAARAFALIEVIAEVQTGASDDGPPPAVLMHAPMLVARMVEAVVARIQDPPPEPLTPTVEKGMAAVAAVAQALREAHDDIASDPDDMGASGNRKLPMYEELVPAVSHLLSKVWLPSAWGLGSFESAPAPSCLPECSHLLLLLLHACTPSNTDIPVPVSPEHVAQCRPLLGAYAMLVPDWEAWNEEEDEPVLAVMDAVCQMPDCEALLLTSQLPGAAPVVECFAAFLVAAVAGGCSEPASRACLRVHMLLHAACAASNRASVEPLAVMLAGAACSRLQGLDTTDLPLAVPLVLAVGAGLARSPQAVVNSLAAGGGEWVSAARNVLAASRLSMQSELQLVACALVRLLQVLGSSGNPSVRADAMEGVLLALVQLQNLSKEEHMAVEESDSEDEGDSDEEGVESGEESGEDDELQEETEQAFLERYAKAAQELAQETNNMDAGDVEDYEDELMLGGLFCIDEGVQERDGAWDMIPAIASIFISWLRAHGSATDLGSLAALLQARPIEGLNAVSELPQFVSAIQSPSA